MGETRVDLQHLIEDLRDQYPFSIEEAIITEIVANALDSDASEIRLLAAGGEGVLTIIDDGKGMSQSELETYHDIAATTKIRGEGIGFAGVGAKLALLLGSYVQTETKQEGFHAATIWHLDDKHHAPWEFMEPSGYVTSPSGTAISININDPQTKLLNEEFLQQAITRHFYPLLDQGFDPVTRVLYLRGVRFLVDGHLVALESPSDETRFFPIYVGRRPKGRRNPDGIGFLRRWPEDIPEDRRGVAISVYGKVITRGWDWLDIPVRARARLEGIVEMPGLSEVLTTSKTDFMRYGAGGQKYYRYRKGAQEAVIPVLRSLGELSEQRERHDEGLEPLQKEIEMIVGSMFSEYPELNALFDRQGRGEVTQGVVPDVSASLVGSITQGTETMTGILGGNTAGKGVDVAAGDLPGERIDPSLPSVERGRMYQGHRRPPGIFIGYEDDPHRQELAWLLEGTVWINRSHPAFRRAADSGAASYHIVVSVVSALLDYVEPEKRPQFINRFLAGWGSRS